MPPHPPPLPVGPGQESVWDYPRPPAVARSAKRVTVTWGGRTVADTTAALRVLETSHPPNWYLPFADLPMGLFRASRARNTFCEWKGLASYLDLVVPGAPVLEAVAWTYPEPSAGYEMLRDHLALYPTPLECTVAGEPVRGQDGGYYGGWVTDDVVGPFKGGPGTLGW